MSKLGLIIKREYLVRVRKLSFILATILTPVGIALFYGVIILMVLYQGDESLKVAVIDEAKIVDSLKTEDAIGNVIFKIVAEPIEEVKADLKSTRKELSKYDAILVIPSISDPYSADITVDLFSEKTPTFDTQLVIEKWLEHQIEAYKMEALGIEKNKLEALKTKLSIDPKPIDESSQDKATSISAQVGAGIASIMSVFLFFIITMYGSLVMRGVMEEKMSRIVEVMVSSVRPFELMLGKIIGIGLVGLTQIAIWVVLVSIMTLVAGIFFGVSMMDNAIELPNGTNQLSGGADMEMAQLILTEIQRQKWWLIIPTLILFFLGGYFMYASLFAAVGSAVGDDLGESQSLTFPIMLPVILAFYLTIFIVVRSPNSSISVWASMIPLFSPIVMPARMAFDPPIWQVLLSLGIMLATTVFFVWLSGRIYRVGILLYGKKATFKEIWKWTFYKS